MEGECGKCGTRFRDDLLRGTAQPSLVSRDGRPRMFVIEGVGLCEPCNMVTNVRYRLYDDMSMTGPKDGEWARWLPRYSLWSRVQKFLRSML